MRSSWVWTAIGVLSLVLVAYYTFVGTAEEPGQASGQDGELRLLQDLGWNGGGEAVLRLENGSGRPVTLEFTSGQVFEAELYRGQEKIWAWSATRLFAQGLQQLLLEPGEVESFDIELPDLDPGAYRLRAWVVSRSPVLPPVEVTAEVR